MDHLNVLLLVMVFMVVVQNGLDVVIVGLLREVKLYEKAQNDHDVGGNGAAFAVAWNFFAGVFHDFEKSYSREIATTEKELETIDNNGTRCCLLELV